MRRLLPVLIACASLAACGEPAPPSPVDGGPPDVPAATCSTDDECDDDVFCDGAERCVAGRCSEGEPPCASGRACDEERSACLTDCAVARDHDGDGADAIECGGDDCDDDAASVYPGAPEVCDLDGVDEDCDPETLGVRDLDGDGALDARCCNGERCGQDCDDLAADVEPGASEVCNARDDDCDGLADETVGVEVWPDLDHDLHGDADAEPVVRCADTRGFAPVADDCDDSRADVHAAQVEICDAVDNDCDGTADESPVRVTWYLDADGDGFGSADPATARVSCAPLPGYSLLGTDCDDGARGISPGAIEQCNGRDDDCNGIADFPIAGHGTEDDDGDGVADAMCSGGTDCDDRDPFTRPGATEICDRRDNDCDGAVDDDTAMGVWYRDLDRDTYGDADAPPGDVVRAGRGARAARRRLRRLERRGAPRRARALQRRR